MKKIKYLVILVIVLCVFGATNVLASSIAISGNSVFRKGATEATINFISNSDGNVFYIVDDSSSASIGDFAPGENAGEVLKDVTKTIEVKSSLLSSGAKYVHIMVVYGDNNSNILTIPMPKDVYYFDDFEAYTVNSYPSFFEIKHDGGNSANQKITEINQNNVFNGRGTYGTGLDERIRIDAVSSGYAVFEADVSASTVPIDEWQYAGLSLGAIYDNDDRNVLIRVSPANNTFGTNNHVSNVVFEANKIYRVKIIVDIANDKYDYYINGTKMNSESLNAISYTQLTWFGIYSGGGTIYYDNMKFYTQTTIATPFTITKGTETNGTFTIDSASAEQGETITITPSANVGYRVKSVKINGSESGITNNNTNYTFTMPATNVQVTVEFEKIPLTITVNTVTGATITPNGTINVKYGDSQEITITANSGYRLVSVKINDDIQELPLTNNKLTINNIDKNSTVEVTVQEIVYQVTVGAEQERTIGNEVDAVFEIDADKSLFDKAYLDDEELLSDFYTVTEGSTIITLKQEFLNNLLPGEYALRATFTDGGEASTTFKIVQAIEKNPETGDTIMLSVILASISLIGIFGVGIYLKKSDVKGEF